MAAAQHPESSRFVPGPHTVSVADVAVIGAGLIGLSAALELAQAGQRVIVFDRNQAMQQASQAAAGMLAANDPGNPSQMLELSRYSLSLYPEFLAQIQALSDRSVPLRTQRTLEGVAVGHALPSGVPEIRLSAAQLQQFAPGLATQGLSFFALEEQSLDPRDLAAAMPAAVRASGVELREHTPVLRVEREGEYHRVVYSASGGEDSRLARHVLLAAGAWPVPLPASGLPAVAPCKGQLAELHLEGPIQTACVLRIPGLYIVPRGSGRYVVGATLERAGYDLSLDEAQLVALERRAAALWPPLARARRINAWAGLRPECPDGLPVIGPLAAGEPAARNLWLAMGHFRNGILQAPGTARILRDLILGQKPAISIEPFRAERLTQPFSVVR